MCEKIEHWNNGREQENLVEEPQMLDLYLNKNFDFAKLSWMAKKIVKEFQFLLLRFILTAEVLTKEFIHGRGLVIMCLFHRISEKLKHR